MTSGLLARLTTLRENEYWSLLQDQKQFIYTYMIKTITAFEDKSPLQPFLGLSHNAPSKKIMSHFGSPLSRSITSKKKSIHRKFQRQCIKKNVSFVNGEETSFKKWRFHFPVFFVFVRKASVSYLRMCFVPLSIVVPRTSYIWSHKFTDCILWSRLDRFIMY